MLSRNDTSQVFSYGNRKHFILFERPLRGAIIFLSAKQISEPIFLRACEQSDIWKGQRADYQIFVVFMMW